MAANWPAYALAGGGLILSLVLIAVLATRNWLAFIPMTLAALIVLLYYLSTALWTAHMLYDKNGLNPHHVLFDMGRIESDDSFAFIDLGRRQAATELSHRLTSGKILVVDVYSPQWTPSRALARERTNAMLPASDPRVEWYAGDINLLPLPDRSVSAVVICHVLSQFWQRGDQLVLLKEIHRILAPDGRMLLAERTRTEINWLLMGPLALRLPRSESWRDLVARSGFLVKEERSLQGLTHCFRADRNQPEAARQLALKLGF